MSRRGVRLGVDVGTVRVGIAVSDPDGMLAAPVETVARDVTDRDFADVARIVELVVERGAVEVIVGLPRSLSGGEGPAARAAREYAERLAARLDPVPVRLVDERLTTVAAQRGLRERGLCGRRSRAVIDQAAAVLLLQTALDAERARGQPLGEKVQVRHAQ